MFMNFRRIRRCQRVQLVTTGFVLSVLMVCWVQLDHHVENRYLVNSFDFINKSFGISQQESESLSNFLYLINHHDKCNSNEVLLLLFVKSSPENLERRQAIRATWGNENYIQRELGANVRVLFALGVYSNPQQRGSVQRGLLGEDQVYGDLVQQDFVDTFHNLTIKLLLQFRWRHTYCSKARFLMSADDDIFIHMPNLVHYLQGLIQQGARDLWVGHVHRGAPPIRQKDSKYHVPYEMYQWPSYPDYTAGAGYVVSRDVAAKIYQATLFLNASLYIDDVFMGICANAMGVSPQEHVYFSGEGKAPYHPCIYDKMITSHGHVADVRRLWKAAMDPQIHDISSGQVGKLYCTAVKIMLLCKPYYLNTYPCKAAFS
ncbi:lactosylceramide 1,3-N-acetyl-beta-D-glucosaminyltransferase A-like isoform X1 [Oncorhynchus keta]|uniref:lactosylceramide 1,3-N-acetyl-beta-D-glucosaminyltransferase A-like isoform X1 n=1 Tax=Oncorhynchus keta TaxID=8018 RepID=UPI0015FC1553|nr:lactosylceramide 1,3-N-acetyl-beta-D-glucosaminyltransferase A-like isoform X1 [Oncorhynchus keta]XP_035638626.1 lactosylceramide 1,3-N-acetyl-beta-D-glucosaminyltransferase A-like isoform X1 [Oncorhynchus keta]XP_035638630.1 lactosylceramide 1,3-N-acetyl-beta-D-glucosaminyltransferase A-like isoform X1 [Oncorhynchus keta]